MTDRANLLGVALLSLASLAAFDLGDPLDALGEEFPDGGDGERALGCEHAEKFDPPERVPRRVGVQGA